jgi:hypothetical protein
MANLQVKDGAAADKYLKGTGAGSVGDPFIPEHLAVLGAGTAEIGKLAAGTAVIGKLGANSGTDIGDVDVTSVVPIDRRAIPSVAGDVNAPAAATAAVITYASGGGQTKHYIHSVIWSYDATPAAGSLIIEDVSGTTVFSVAVTAAGPGQLVFDPPIISSAVATAMIVTLASGGAGVTGKVNGRHEVK